METLVKIKFNKKFKMFEALTACSVKGKKVQKFGNDYNITGSTEKEVVNKVNNTLKEERIIFV